MTKSKKAYVLLVTFIICVAAALLISVTFAFVMRFVANIPEYIEILRVTVRG